MDRNVLVEDRRIGRKEGSMLKHTHKHQTSAYGQSNLIEEKGQTTLTVEIRPRQKSRPVRAGCRTATAGYDRLSSRRFEFIPFWWGVV